MYRTQEIKGHPTVEAYRPHAEALQITVCANCESLKSVLFLSRDRWFCTKCRNQGDASPRRVAVSNPKKGSTL